jgi:hypothetical protein
MTIIGLPYDTEDSIMSMAEWVTKISKYQTANLLTPLPATSNWTALTPLDEEGSVLPEGKTRPYHLYTGRQLVHHDERWSMQESRQLFDKFNARLNPVDNLYGRIFRLLQTSQFRQSTAGKEPSGAVSARISEFSEVLRTLSDSSKELPETIATRMHEMTEALGRYRLQLSATGKELPEVIAARINEASEALGKYRQQISNTGREISDTISIRINEASEAMTMLSELSRKPA